MDGGDGLAEVTTLHTVEDQIRQNDGPRFAPGFRLSLSDVVVLVCGAAGAFIAGRESLWHGVAIGFVVGHFFLFCNVFRFARGPELLWAAIFTSMASCTAVAKVPGWPVTLGVALLCTIALVAREIRKPDYHGIAWRTINPGLEAWWREHRGR